MMQNSTSLSDRDVEQRIIGRPPQLVKVGALAHEKPLKVPDVANCDHQASPVFPRGEWLGEKQRAGESALQLAPRAQAG